ncbi:GL14879 [Drosophila persimilis]|uniref:GL14879 n=2 Tax=Drosophila persimilis TaxID=7234 RepID=B4H0D7_DROPE|nr:GL14879 [Drosophila persimilis]
MVNAVMDAIALLSSLASDLDVMLNDLRSAPSHATANQQQPLQQPQQQPQQQLQSRQLLQPLHHWQSISNNNLPHPMKTIRSANPTISAQNCPQNNRRRVAPKPLPRPPRRSRPAIASAAAAAREADDAEEDTDASDLANMTSPLSASAAATRIMGLSPEVKKVQRLPLWCHPHAPPSVQPRPQRRPSQRHHHHG